MARALVYIKPFTDAGTYESEWTDVTKYVQSVGGIGIDTDSSEFQIGVYRNSSVKLTMNNRDGKFSDVDVVQSMFAYKRADSLVKISFLEDEVLPYCGMSEAGAVHLCEEIETFVGLLSDDSLTQDARTEEVTFQVLGPESLFSRVTVPFDDIADLDTVSEVLYAILNQSPITDLLTVSLSNMDPALDLALDDVADLENKTGKESIDKLLLHSNSVLYIENLTIYVTARTPTVAIQKTFFGQASRQGPEDIINIKNITNGKNRIFNFATWRETTTSFVDNDSVSLHGARKKELDFAPFTDTGKRLQILEAIVDEFATPKQELELETILDSTTIALSLLDRVAIDYPTVYVQEDFELPICGVAVCGDAVLPRGLWSFYVPTTRNYKIIKKTLDLQKFTASFKLREI